MTSRLVRCGLVAAIASVVAAVGVLQAQAQSPLRIVVPVPAGGSSDVVARLLAEQLRDELSRPVIVENRVGATGRVAVQALANAPRDGTTLLLAPIVVPVIGPLVLKYPGYVPARDLVPVSHVARYQFGIAVAAAHPARDVASFVAWAKSRPTPPTFGTAGTGSVPHLLGAWIGRDAGIDLLHVPYRGVGQIETDLVAGEISAAVGSLSDFIPLHESGRIRILASAGNARSRSLPGVATLAEQGYPSIVAEGWHGVFAPAGTPQSVIEPISAAIATALRSPTIRERFSARELDATGTTPAALAAKIDEDTTRWRRVIEAVGFTAE